MTNPLLQRFTNFLGVGALGFLVDAGTFALALERLELSSYAARLAAFTAAATFTWVLNRRYTFAKRRSDYQAAEFGRYALASAVAGSVNLGSYFLVLCVTGSVWPWPYVALAAGVGVGLAVNFLLYDRFVFPGFR